MKEKIKTVGLLITGAWLGNLLWAIRINNLSLRDEMIYYLQEGENYFLNWFVGFSGFIVLLWIVYFVYLYRHSHNTEEVKK